MLGCEDEERSCANDEKPGIWVNVGSFVMSKYEVTQWQYKAVMGENPSYFDDCPACPVEQVSWNDAQIFIRALNTMRGNPYKYRLPAEREWESFYRVPACQIVFVRIQLCNLEGIEE